MLRKAVKNSCLFAMALVMVLGAACSDDGSGEKKNSYEKPEVILPEGYTNLEVVITKSDVTPPETIGDIYKPIGDCVDISIKGTDSYSFGDKLAEVKFNYDKAELEERGLVENFLVFYYDEAGTDWKPVEKTENDSENSVVTGYTSHFTDFVLAGSPVTITEFTLTSRDVTLDNIVKFTMSGIGVAGWKVTTSAIAPSGTSSGWVTPAPAQYTLPSTTYGVYNLYAWAKDAKGNVSEPKTIQVEYVQRRNSGSMGLHYSYHLYNYFVRDRYTTVNGYLEISNGNNYNYAIKHLNDTKYLFEVNYNFYVYSNNYLENIDGLPNLTTVGADLVIRNNQVLYSINGINNLVSVNGNVYIGCLYNPISYSSNYQNPILHDIGGFKNLSYVGASIFIGYHNNLTTISGFNSIEYIGANLQIINNPNLQTLSGFTNANGIPAETNIGGSLVISNNSNLMEITGLTEVKHINGDLYIENNPKLRNLDFLKKLTYVGGNIVIKGNTNLQDISGLNNLEQVLGSVIIESNNSLGAINGLQKLVSIGGALTIRYNDALADMPGLVNITAIGGALDISSNSALENIDGLGNVAAINGNVTISGNVHLLNMNGLAGVISINGNVLISYNTAMTTLMDIDGPGNLTIIKGGLTISSNDGLLNLRGLESLQSIGQSYSGDLLIESNYSLESIGGDDGGFSSLQYIYGKMTVRNNPSLIDLDGLENLFIIYRGLYIYNNPSLENIHGLSSVGRVGNNMSGDCFEIDSNNSLTDLGMNSLLKVWVYSGNTFKITYNSTLPNYRAVNLYNQLIPPRPPMNIHHNYTDTIAPVITIEGDNPLTIEVFTTYEDPGAIAIDEAEGDISHMIIISTDINLSAVGTYTVTYNVSDGSGNTAVPAVRTVHVVDTTPPVISLIGITPVNAEAGIAYVDPGVTVYDNYDVDLTADVVNTVNVNVPGQYTVTYSATDSSGNNAIEIRFVNVQDTLPPEITLLGNNPVTVYLMAPYADPGFTALDVLDGDVSEYVVVDGTVDPTKVGTYNITYNVSDQAGNMADQEVRTVNVVLDPVPPVITILGNNPHSMYVGKTYTDAGATASDNIDGNITSHIITQNNVITTSTGTYTVSYTVTDSSGNTVVEERTVEVIPDTTPPVITLIGDATVVLEVGSTYTDQGAMAVDNNDGDISTSIVVESNVNTGVAGTYTVTYNVEDSSGNEAEEVVRTVRVKEWTERPLQGPMSGSSWTDVDSSSDGLKLVAVGSGYLHTSTDGGVTWTRQPSAGILKSLHRGTAISADGTKIAIAKNNGYINTSVDGGVSWTERTASGQRNWQDLCSSSDGTRLFAAVSSGYIYTSIDSGATWTECTTAGSRYWRCITVSSDGMKIAAATWLGTALIYTSIDGGATWTDSTPAGISGIWSIASSSDGTRIFAAEAFGSIVTSLDGGATWAEYGPAESKSWYGIDVSADGTAVAAVVANGSVYTSTDSGTTYLERTSAGTKGWYDVAVSSDGSRIVACNANYGYIYTSPNGGETWTERTAAGYMILSGIAASADGMKIAACNMFSRDIYTSTDGGHVWINRTVPEMSVFTGIASSADGTSLVAVCNTNAYSSGYVYISKDSGETWTEDASLGSKNWKGIVSSSDGTNLFAIEYPGYVYASLDGGDTWSPLFSAGSRRWYGISSSADGQKLAAAERGDPSGGYIYTSEDGGENWVERTDSGQREWISLSSSYDGSVIAAAACGGNVYVGDEPGYIYISIDGGATWNEKVSGGLRPWMQITVSSDGTRIAAITLNGYIYTSSDGGETWTEQVNAGSRNWTGITSTLNGGKIAAVASGEKNIFIYE